MGLIADEDQHGSEVRNSGSLQQAVPVNQTHLLIGVIAQFELSLSHVQAPCCEHWTERNPSESVHLEKSWLALDGGKGGGERTNVVYPWEDQ